MKNNMVKQLMLGTCLCLFASHSHAGLPEVDWPQLGAEVSNAVSKLKTYYESSETAKKAIELYGELSELNVDATNNGFANLMARNGRRTTEIEGKNLLERLSTSPLLCGGISTSASLNEVNCESQGLASYKSLSEVVKRSSFKNSKKEAIERADTLVSRIKDGHSDLFAAPGESDLTEEYSPLAMDPSYLMSSSKRYLNLDEQEYQAATDFVELLVPSIQFEDIDANDMDDVDQLAIAEREVPILLAKSVLMNSISVRTPSGVSGSGPDAVSRLATYQQIIDDYSDPNAVHSLGNGNISTPTALLRDQLLKKIMKAKFELEQFKSSLRSESLESAILLQALKPEAF